MSEQWMSIVEYARQYAISDMTVRRRIKNGKLHAILRDGKYYIPIHGSPSDAKPQHHEASSRISHSPVKSIPPNIAGQHARQTMPSETSFPKYGSDLAVDSHIAPEEPPQVALHRPSLDTQALLNYFEKTLAQFSTVERQLRESYETKILGMEDRLKAKDVEIARLQQQLEDLQTLINMIDQPVKPK